MAKKKKSAKRPGPKPKKKRRILNLKRRASTGAPKPRNKKPTVKRDANGKWLKGSIPNPNGRPAGKISGVDLIIRELESQCESADEVRSNAEEFVHQIIQAALVKAREHKDFKDALAFLKEWLDRTEGKPKQAVEVSRPKRPEEDKSDAEIAALLALPSAEEED